MNLSDFQVFQDFNDGNVTSNSDTGYATSNADMQPENQSNLYGEIDLEELFQPSAPMMPTQSVPQHSNEVYPSDHFNPQVGWYVPAAAYGPGACFNRAIGWYIPVGGAAPAAAPPSAFSSGIPSGFNTPQEVQPQYPQFAAVPFPPQFAPQAPMNPQGPMHVPTIARPQPRPVGPSGYYAAAPQPANTSTQRSQAPRPSPAPAPATCAAATSSRRGRKPHIKKMSLDRACTCKARPEKIPRPPNSFIVYRMAVRHQVARDLSTQDNAEISRESGRRWKALPPAEKAKYKVQADEIALRHKEEHPDYRYVANAKNALDFGDESCTCGAFEANQAYRTRRDAENLAQARAARRGPGRSAVRRPQTPVLTQSQLYEEPEQLPEFDFSDMIPSRPASSKRKRPATPMDIDTPAPKRQTRQSSKVPDYVDPEDTDTDNTFDADADYEIDPNYDFSQFGDFINNNAYDDDFAVQAFRRASSKKSIPGDGRKSRKTSNASSRGTPTRRSARIAVQ